MPRSRRAWRSRLGSGTGSHVLKSPRTHGQPPELAVAPGVLSTSLGGEHHIIRTTSFCRVCRNTERPSRTVTPDKFPRGHTHKPLPQGSPSGGDHQPTRAARCPPAPWTPCPGEVGQCRQVGGEGLQQETGGSAKCPGLLLPLSRKPQFPGGCREQEDLGDPHVWSCWAAPSQQCLAPTCLSVSKERVYGWGASGTEAV